MTNRDLEGTSILITGANTGIGKTTAEALARRGAILFLAGRSEEKTRPVVDALRGMAGHDRVRFVPLDLADLSSVKAAADRFLAEGHPLDVLINNAGLAGARGVTKDGFELAFGTNHLGPFLLTEKLLPRLRESKAPRVVNVASKASFRAKAIDWDALRGPTRTGTGIDEYGVSKLCNILHAKELAKREKGLLAFSLHPGVVASDVWREVPSFLRGFIKLFMISNEEGAKTTVHCATAPDLHANNGGYFDKARPAKEPRLAREPELARKLWDKSAEWVAPFL